MSILHTRLRNCLAAILEIRPCLARNFRANLAADFDELQGHFARLEGMTLAEEDVARMERLTAAFLRQAAPACVRPVAPAGRIQ